jgi:hypothetical protein
MRITVSRAWMKSTKIMIFFLSHRSTNTPEIGVTRINGANAKKAARARINGLPVFLVKYQIMPKRTILEPRIEIHCPERKKKYPFK